MIGDGYKLYYNGIVSNRNGVGIILSQDLTSSVVEVNRISDSLMSIKLWINQSILNILSVYAPQTGCKEEEKDDLRAILDEAWYKENTDKLHANLSQKIKRYKTGTMHQMGQIKNNDRINANIETLDSSKVSEKILQDKLQKSRIATKAVARAKSMAYDDMSKELHTKEGQNKIYRLAKQREKNSRDIN
ncbi:uncharacterized protein LOC135928113 [Gordionus sp. m RMFG-2023]|uniref:uncharacterized protein LOC135928113 n=1 Tax=Gordionus sp. m RMFG-2023 TaxID=3053472 RepID=UPI0031FD3655